MPRPLGKLPFPRIPQEEMEQLYGRSLASFTAAIREICTRTGFYDAAELEMVVADYCRRWFFSLAKSQPVYSSGELLQCRDFVNRCVGLAEARGADISQWRTDAEDRFCAVWWIKLEESQDKALQELLDDALEHYLRASRPDRFK